MLAQFLPQVSFVLPWWKLIVHHIHDTVYTIATGKCIGLRQPCDVTSEMLDQLRSYNSVGGENKCSQFVNLFHQSYISPDK